MTAKIKLNAASGGGSFSLQAPSSSSNNRVMTLPDTADGTILTTTNPKTGNILQVVSTTKTDTASHSVAVGGVSGDVMTASITPSSSSNKVLVMFSIYIGTPDEGGYGTIYRDGSVVTAATGDANGSRQRISANTFVLNDNRASNINKIFLDSPATTSSTTYSVRIGGSYNGTATYTINRSYQWLDDNRRATGISTLTLMEVAA